MGAQAAAPRPSAGREPEPTPVTGCMLQVRHKEGMGVRDHLGFPPGVGGSYPSGHGQRKASPVARGPSPALVSALPWQHQLFLKAQKPT